jgi:hypothetical protein
MDTKTIAEISNNIEKRDAMNAQRSPEINELAIALAKAQAAIVGAAKDKTNPHFKSKYADLSSVWDASRKPLSDNGLSVVQIPSAEGDTVTVTTILMHISGQFIQGSLTTLNQNMKNVSQGIGSCITYARRYALSSFVGICPDDDDGQGSAGTGTRAAPRPEAPKPEVTPDMRKRLFAMLGQSSWSPAQLKEVMLEKFGFDSTSNLNRSQYEQICEALLKNPKPAEPKTIESMKESGELKPGTEV